MKLHMLFVEYQDGMTENIYDSDESKLWDLADEIRADNEIKRFSIEEVVREEDDTK